MQPGAAQTDFSLFRGILLYTTAPHRKSRSRFVLCSELYAKTKTHRCRKHDRDEYRFSDAVRPVLHRAVNSCDAHGRVQARVDHHGVVDLFRHEYAHVCVHVHAATPSSRKIRKSPSSGLGCGPVNYTLRTQSWPLTLPPHLV